MVDPADKPRILITGAMGQLGSGLAQMLRGRYGRENVIMSDIIKPPRRLWMTHNPYLYIDVLDMQSLEGVVVNFHIDWIVHFSAILSAVGEQNVPLALRINVEGLHNVVEIAKTIYGVTKVYAELLGEYMYERFNLDFRSLRLPGVISATQPGGGTTDYAVKIFHDALNVGEHMCYLKPNTRLPMMYINDCLRSVVEMLEAPAESLRRRTYNVTAMSFTPEEIASAIKQVLPHFRISYNICPIRQAIAETWPESLDDNGARMDWGWNHEFDLKTTVDTMIKLLAQEYSTSPYRGQIISTGTL